MRLTADPFCYMILSVCVSLEMTVLSYENVELHTVENFCINDGTFVSMTFKSFLLSTYRYRNSARKVSFLYKLNTCKNKLPNLLHNIRGMNSR